MTDIEKAKTIIETICNDPKSFTLGRRNNDCVDIGIAYYVLVMSDDGDLFNVKIHKLIDFLTEKRKDVDTIDIETRLDILKSYCSKWYTTDNIYNYLTRPIEDYIKEEN